MSASPPATVAPAGNVAPAQAVSPPATVPPGERLVDGQPVIDASGAWVGGSLAAATTLSVPIALGVAVLVFVIVQWLIDRRDPKFIEAPARKDDDSVGFE